MKPTLEAALKRAALVIVDGCSNGQHYAKKLRENYSCIHVQSTPTPPKFYLASFNPSDYDANIIYQGGTPELARELSKYDPIAIIAGSEYGVDLTEALLSHFELPSNDLSLPLARRNKHVMARHIEENQLAVIPSIKTHNWREASEWIEQTANWPAVVKAIDGSGGVDFRLCESVIGIKAAFESMLASTNFLGLRIEELLVQKLVRGTEFSVNTVSYNGKHYVTDIQKYTKLDLPNGKRTYLNVELISYEEACELPGFLEYVSAVLNALGIKLGPAHTEIMQTSEGPVLMETTVRPGGGLPAPVVAECVSIDQVSASVDAYTQPEKFLAQCQSPYKLKQYFYLVHLISTMEGVVTGFKNIAEIKQLPTFRCMYGLPDIGSKITVTEDLGTTAGYICLMSIDRTQLRNDYKTIRSLEKNGLFHIDQEVKRCHTPTIFQSRGPAVMHTQEAEENFIIR